jgi:hypothetical protein
MSKCDPTTQGTQEGLASLEQEQVYISRDARRPCIPCAGASLHLKGRKKALHPLSRGNPTIQGTQEGLASLEQE